MKIEQRFVNAAFDGWDILAYMAGNWYVVSYADNEVQANMAAREYATVHGLV